MTTKKEKANELEKIKNHLSCIIIKNADGKALKQLDKLCLTAFEFGKKEGREGVIKEIEKNMLVDEEGDIFISKRVWECFKHNPLKESVIIGKTKGGKRK